MGGFVGGLLAGAALSALLVGAVSLAVPLPLHGGGAAGPVASLAEPAETPDAAPDLDAVAPDADAAGDVAAETPATQPEAATPETGVVEVPAGSEFAKAKPEEDAILPGAEPGPPAAEAPVVAAPAAEPAPDLASLESADAPEGQSEAPAAPDAPEAPAAPGDALSTEAPAVTAPEPATLAPSAAEADAPEADTTPAPEPEPEAEPEAVAEAAQEPVPGADPDAAPPPAEPEPDAQPAADEAPAEPEDLPPVISPDAPEPPIGVADAPQPGFRPVPGVKVNRLPSIGETGIAPEMADGGAGIGAAEDGTLPVVTVDDADQPAVRRYGAAFENPDNLPLVSLIIVDRGEAAGGLSPETLATFAFPVTIAIDPTLPDARARADLYRAAGFEIALLASTLTDAATASDLEVMYQGYREALPDAALFLGTETAPFQSNRQAAEHLVAMLKPDGMGLISYAKGLNPASGIAAEESLPHAEIWRVLDEGGARSEAIRRALDRAAFEAVQTGQVVVMASSVPETVTAIFGWAAEGAKGVALAPVSAVALKAVGGGAAVTEPAPTP